MRLTYADIIRERDLLTVAGTAKQYRTVGEIYATQGRDLWEGRAREWDNRSVPEVVAHAKNHFQRLGPCAQTIHRKGLLALAFDSAMTVLKMKQYGPINFAQFREVDPAQYQNTVNALIEAIVNFDYKVGLFSVSSRERRVKS